MHISAHSKACRSESVTLFPLFPMDFCIKNKKSDSWVEILHFSSTLAQWLVFGEWVTPSKDTREVIAKALVALWSCAMRKGPYRGSGVVSFSAKSKLKFWIQVINFRPRPLWHKVSKNWGGTFPPWINVASLTSSATPPKNMFCAPCVIPRGLSRVHIIL